MTAPTKNVVDLPVLGGVVTGDKLIVVDVSDTTEGPLGTTKVATLETIESIFDDSLAEAAASAATATTKAADASASAALAEAIALGVASGRPSVRPTLMLDFVNSDVVDPRITFTRASAGAYYDGKTYAKAEENLFLQSEDFSSASWVGVTGSKPSVTINATTAPDGNLTADALVYDVQYKGIGQNNLISGFVYTYSIWLRIASGTRDLNLVRTDGTILATFTITSTWQRFTNTFTSTSEQVGLQDRNASGFVDVFAWGAQLEQRSSVTAYTPTTTAPITRYQMQLLSAGTDVWRPDYDPVTGVCSGRLVEPAATNLLTYSEDFSNAAWVKTNCTVDSNVAIAPDGTSTVDAIVEDTATGAHYLTQTVITAGGVHTFSVHGKLGARYSIALSTNIANANAVFNLSTGTITSTGAAAASGVEYCGNGVIRCWISITTVAAAGVNFDVLLIDGTGASSYTGDGSSSSFVWGAQLEAGPLTSYIKTTGATATRAADLPVMTGENFSSWFNQAEGTFLISAAPAALGGWLLSASDGTANNKIQMNGGSTFHLGVEVNAVQQVAIDAGTFVAGENSILAVAYKANDFAASLDGGAAVTDSSGTLPSVDRLYLANGATGSGDGTICSIAKLIYWPKKLTSAEIQILSGSGA